MALGQYTPLRGSLERDTIRLDRSVYSVLLGGIHLWDANVNG